MYLPLCDEHCTCCKYNSEHNNIYVNYICRVCLKINSKGDIKQRSDVWNRVRRRITISVEVNWEGPTEKVMLSEDVEEIVSMLL